MDAMLRDKAEELAKEIAVSISTQQELSDVMRLMTKSVIDACWTPKWTCISIRNAVERSR